MESELQILYQYTEIRSLFWEFILYWTSVSFGLMVASHVAAKALHTVVVFMIMLLYIAFSVWLGFAFASNGQIIEGLMQDLETLRPFESMGAKAVYEVHRSAETSKVPFFTLFFAIAGTFFGTVTFLWYSHLKSCNESA